MRKHPTRLVQLAFICCVVSVWPLAPAATQSHEPLDQFISHRIAVSESQTIFSVFALLNAGGYDHENSTDGMHPVRKLVRERLAEMTPAPLRERIKAFYRSHPVENINYTYGVVAVATSGPPSFAFSKSWQEISSQDSFRNLTELPELLRELYAKVPLPAIYESVRQQYQEAISAQRDLILREVRSVMAYCRVKGPEELAGGGEVKKAVIIPNLLESYQTAFSFVWDDTFYSVDGPQKHPGYNPHEFVHSVTNPMSYNPKYAKTQGHAQRLFDAARTIPEMRSEFSKLDAYFDENLVRAICLKYLENGDGSKAERLRAAMMREYGSGYILERFFYEQLAGYEKSGEPLGVYYPRMLARLNAAAELERWRQKKTEVVACR